MPNIEISMKYHLNDSNDIPGFSSKLTERLAIYTPYLLPRAYVLVYLVD